jgi:CRISPR/Cas system CSM-associated protein Csm3 (group 7 of RAMP superfamily)
VTAVAEALLNDPGGVRPVAARWVITADLILESATHLGAGRGDAADMVLLRDGRSGAPLLPGTSLAGALRSHLADILGGYGSDENPAVTRLFGGARGQDPGAQSPLIVFDSIGKLPDHQTIEIRDGVQIETSRGIAEDHKKFDFEVVPAGTVFPLRFDLVVPEARSEGELVGLLVRTLSGLAEGDISIGARRSRGLGSARTISWRAVRYDLQSKEGWIEWTRSDWEQPLSGASAPFDIPRQACQHAWQGLEFQEFEDRRRRIVVEAELVAAAGLLVRSAPVEPGAPDAVHLRSGGRSILPGTSIAGVLRTQALRIAGVVRNDKADAQRWVERLFGPKIEGTVPAANIALRASRLRVSESWVQDGKRVRPSRVRIDRFTQGVVPGALFDEEPDYHGRVRLRMELRTPERGEMGLLVLLIKDLLTGEIAVGGTGAVGRGRFTGRATLRLEDGRSVPLEPHAPGDSVVDQAIEAFWSESVLEADLS